MGILKLFSRSGPTLQALPSGSVTVDRHGAIVVSTVSSTYRSDLLQDIAREVLRLFREARAAHVAMVEFNIHFASLQITARELRGGAIIFLSPKTNSSVN
jgi:hypothetical protein